MQTTNCHFSKGNFQKKISLIQISGSDYSCLFDFLFSLKSRNIFGCMYLLLEGANSIKERAIKEGELKQE